MNEAGSSAVPDQVADEALDDLRARIRRTRRVANPWADDGARGLPAAELDALLEHWSTGYDWRDHERRIRSLPWVMAGRPGAELRLIHQRAADPSASAVVLLHGWPDSVLRFERVLPLLADLHVVVPALPGFPFAFPLASPASVNRIAEGVADAVGDLGYDRYTVSGGDVGGDVAEILAAGYPDRVTALHLTNVSPRHAAAANPARLPPEAAAYLGQAAQWFRSEGGYIAEQSTRPGTLIAGLADSPAGLAAWITEKLTAWSGAATAFTRDEILTWVTAYWLTGSIGTSFATYAEPAAIPDRIDTPTVLSAFPHDIKPAPRSYAEAFVDVREFIEHNAGGHFAAWEQPAAYADDLRRAVRLGGARVLDEPDRAPAQAAAAAAIADVIVLCDLAADDPAVTDALSRRTPLVTIGYPKLPGVPRIAIDNRRAAALAASHLLALGHQRFCVLTIGAATDGAADKAGRPSVEARTAGFTGALAADGVAPDQVIRRAAENTFAGAAAVMSELLAQPAPRRPTAVFAVTDVLALGTLAAARSVGLAVPGQLSVVGFDDIAQSAASSPPLTTVSQPLFRQGQAAAGIALAQIAGQRYRVPRMTAELVVRTSTGPVG